MVVHLMYSRVIVMQVLFGLTHNIISEQKLEREIVSGIQ